MTALLMLTLAAAPPPAWQFTVDVDGQKYVTDKVVVLAEKLAKPGKELPAATETVAPAVAAIIKHPAATRVPLSKLQRGKFVTAPNGMQLGATYVDFLAARVGEKALSFGFVASCQPVLVYSGEAVVGALSPLSTIGD